MLSYNRVLIQSSAVTVHLRYRVVLDVMEGGMGGLDEWASGSVSGVYMLGYGIREEGQVGRLIIGCLSPGVMVLKWGGYGGVCCLID